MILLELFGIIVSLVILSLYILSCIRYKTARVEWGRRWKDVRWIFGILNYIVGFLWDYLVLVPFLGSIDWSFWSDFWSIEMW